MFPFALVLAAATASAEPLPFDGTWKEQGFFRFWSNTYVQTGGALEIESDGTVSLLWRPVSAADRHSTRASWSWSVAQGVGPTDLTQKGGDDRNISIYFVFTDPETALHLSPRSARRLLRSKTTRALAYVWGGDQPRGVTLSSPYSPRLSTLIRRPATTGAFFEDADLQADFRRSFGDTPAVLVGVGVSADSDDTDGRIRARLADLTLN